MEASNTIFKNDSLIQNNLMVKINEMTKIIRYYLNRISNLVCGSVEELQTLGRLRKMMASYY